MKTIYTRKREAIIVDDEDFLCLQKYSWYISRTGYVACGRYGDEKKHILIHRAIMQPEKGMVVDHINGDKLDNRRCNLRICTQKENTYNIHTLKKSKAVKNYKGVTKTPGGRYRARITQDKIWCIA